MVKKTDKKEGMDVKVIAKKYSVPEAITVDIDGNKLVGSLREFSTGSKGYYLTGKVVINSVKCQVSGSIVIVGSKE